MKKTSSIIIVLSILISLVGCSIQNDLIENEPVRYHWVIEKKENRSNDEFSFLIKDNPIDVSYNLLCEDNDGSATEMVSNSTTYRDWWLTELNAAYNSLLSLLDDRDKKALISSQNAWNEYMSSSDKLNKAFFYEHKYGDFGMMRRGYLCEEEAKQTKERAYLLLEYLYTITGEIKFIFNPTT